jgi:N-methylhydantoinase A
LRKTPVLDGEKLAAGNTIRGPAIVETADTTVVVHPGTRLRVDALGNFEMTFARQAMQ